MPVFFKDELDHFMNDLVSSYRHGFDPPGHEESRATHSCYPLRRQQMSAFGATASSAPCHPVERDLSLSHRKGDSGGLNVRAAMSEV
ncbi:MAG: hypothetical protein OEU68_11460 [Nitrospira sp.]|nr:hypothetical protein [Nitrospira sp.]MDH4244632.1 hypothetical protein [Nitrospira sp.]MDH4358091.1 hypothetical protein [Nitrospira sp.]MDH5318488.1 hypothetical protein [Nitrospira sp.]